MSCQANDTEKRREAIIPQGAAYFAVETTKSARHFAFHLLPEFTLLAFSAALDPLRIANQLAQRPLYRWTVSSQDGAAATSSCGISVNVDESLSPSARDTDLVVCGGTVRNAEGHKELQAVLRQHARFGGRVGGICTGAIALAQAGLLAGRKATLHWENQPAFHEKFPEVEVTSNTYEVDGRIFTCGGGVGATDMMLEIIEDDYGQPFANLVADMCLYAQRRSERSPQRTSISNAIESRNPLLVRAIKLMQANIETPTAMEDLADAAGCSRRQMERLFVKYLDKTPYRFFRDLRLDRGRSLLRETDMSVTEIAVASGFTSPVVFIKCFRERFGHSPGKYRKAK
ncbi:transcriptional regulator, AraC family with amidase-like domain [Roseovarius marisflavi]|uniref:Transcriptional regulator, AraC family with amidase-like domain n=1 Tax=Roseovarius marisflavi TaxID=1054996 RepID=A0A1M6XN60_9RHOB|nr:GlxA family transcriptional regulator [Roseovarius marisflavi]SHL07346.1 transcriptional regulator, AraC family with amidase-like domain [Roseovarius marisflavi]